MILFVARHGETDYNREGRYQGQLESTLTATGELQARALAAAMAQRPIGRVVSSPLRRCVATALPVAAALRREVETDARLLEIHHGTWQGRLRDDIEREDALRFAQWRSAPQRVAFEGGEMLSDVQRRFDEFVATLNGNSEVVLVTHDVLVRLAILRATSRGLDALWEPQVVNGGYARIEVEGDAWRLLDESVERHLGELRIDPNQQAL